MLTVGILFSYPAFRSKSHATAGSLYATPIHNDARPVSLLYTPSSCLSVSRSKGRMVKELFEMFNETVFDNKVIRFIICFYHVYLPPPLSPFLPLSSSLLSLSSLSHKSFSCSFQLICLLHGTKGWKQQLDGAHLKGNSCPSSPLLA